MTTTYDKLDTINDSLNDIKTAIIGKGQTPSGNITTYATAIDNIVQSSPVIDSLSITPTTSAQTITAPSGTDGYSPVNVAAVTAAIDSNIQAGNIKKDVTILNVTGTYEGSGGGIDHGGDYLIKVIDYDGTVLKQDHLNTGATFTLPNAPTHSRLTFQDWAAPVNITNNTITVGKADIIVGAVYTPTSGLNEFDITLTPLTGLSITFNMNGTKDWGDGTSNTATSHTYSSYGNYTIKCGGTFNSYTNTSGMFGQSGSAQNFFCKNAFFANTNIPSHVVSNCMSLENITFPDGILNLNMCAYDLYTLKALIIPNSVTSSGVFQRVNPQTIVFGKNVQTISDWAFWGGECFGTRKIIFPASVTRVSGNSFYNCKPVLEYNFTNHTSMPTLSDTSAFYNINKIAKIKVPSSLVTSWKSATNWATYADYIEGV